MISVMISGLNFMYFFFLYFGARCWILALDWDFVSLFSAVSAGLELRIIFIFVNVRWIPWFLVFYFFNLGCLEFVQLCSIYTIPLFLKILFEFSSFEILFEFSCFICSQWSLSLHSAALSSGTLIWGYYFGNLQHKPWLN